MGVAILAIDSIDPWKGGNYHLPKCPLSGYLVYQKSTSWSSNPKILVFPLSGTYFHLPKIFIKIWLDHDLMKSRVPHWFVPNIWGCELSVFGARTSELKCAPVRYPALPRKAKGKLPQKRLFFCGGFCKRAILPKTQIHLKYRRNDGFQKELPFPGVYFQVPC